MPTREHHENNNRTTEEYEAEVEAWKQVFRDLDARRSMPRNIRH